MPLDMPRDPFMLFSYVNTLLRDHYASLDALCEDMQLDRLSLEGALSEAGFQYNKEQNKFW